MDINIYSKYKVKITTEYSHYSDESIRGDVDIVSEDPEVREDELSGDLLLADLSRLMNDSELDELKVVNNSLYFGYFNPATGLTSSITLEVEEVNV